MTEGNRVFLLETPCTINGDPYTRVEVAPSALKHYEEYYTSRRLTGFEAEAEKAIRYIVGSLCGKRLVPEESKKVVQPSYVLGLTYGTASNGILGISIPAIQDNRESRFHLRPAEQTIYFYHLLEMRKPKRT